jgi:hypothetical protein
MKKARLLVPLVMVLALGFGLAAPAAAWAGLDTTLTVDVSVGTVNAGETVILTISEYNDSYYYDQHFEDAWMEVYQDGVLVATLDQAHASFQGDPGGAYNNIPDGRLNRFETWVWIWESAPITADTTFRVEGWGDFLENDGTHIIFGPTDDPDSGVNDVYDEVEEVTITVTPNGDGEGFTPGYWRNHMEDWPPTGYSPDDLFSDVFGVGPSITLGAYKTGAIWAKGGGENALIRHATAALLNAAHPDADYPLSPTEVIDAVQAAYASGDFDTLKTELDGYNNLGGEL